MRTPDFLDSAHTHIELSPPILRVLAGLPNGQHDDHGESQLQPKKKRLHKDSSAHNKGAAYRKDKADLERRLRRLRLPIPTSEADYQKTINCLLESLKKVFQVWSFMNPVCQRSSSS